MKNQDSSFVIVYIKGSKHIRLNNESELSQGLLDKYPKATKAELYFVEGSEKKLIDTFYNSK
jgi:hypothetical protein